MIAVFADRSHYERNARSELMPLLRPFWKDRESYSVDERIADYGSWVSAIQVVTVPERADFAVLPMSWNYYVGSQKEKRALDFIREAEAANLKILTWSSGDFGMMPLVKRVEIYRPSGYQSRRLQGQYAFPVFFNDPLLANFGIQSSPLRFKADKPVIGFCGQAYSPWYKSCFDVLRTAGRNFSFYTGLSKQDPQMLYPATLRRSNALKLLAADKRIQTNFIIRKSYRAGATSTDDRRKTSLEYYENMMDSDYVLCLRGNGNFSTRLYETLAMGRIPVIINTDCIYPWDELLDWKKLGVWVEASDLKQLPEKLADFHARVSPEGFCNLQLQARKLWLEKLSMFGFFSTLVGRFSRQ